MYSLWNTEQNPSLFSQEKFWTSRPLSCHYACFPTDPINFNYFLHSEIASKRRGKNILNPSIAYSPDIKLKDLDVMLNLLLTDYYVSANKCIWEHILGRAHVALSPSCAPEREETMIFWAVCTLQYMEQLWKVFGEITNSSILIVLMYFMSSKTF